ncbi:glycosyltransferase [Halpernia frigidisoli]|uniref:Glycosyltransferase like family protein n=1 Tax=Halpernia frigidisoli TaxID=1125876 RepID=A0A1I3GLH2_9FLAO|nr:glycosyltransferase [Halpernia frigidisoli]SFI24316.1 Glycosyltransferase like family protein [Halpernia frigidisoli]
MISIIISTYQPAFFQDLEQNIDKTCGVPYEIINIENPGLMSVCETYNKGAKLAKFENYLFLHEDVLFLENNWGEKLINILNLPNCGVVGVAGGDYYGYVPASWWSEGYKKMNIIQADKNSGKDHFNDHFNFKKDSVLEEVKALDGVFLACKKEVYDATRFDEKIEGFHGYDLIFSLKASAKFQNYVTGEVLLKHFSKGSLSKEWLQNILKVRSIIGFNKNQKIDQNVELQNFYKLLAMMKLYNFTKSKSLQIAIKYFNPSIFGLKNSLKVLNRLKYIYIEK